MPQDGRVSMGRGTLPCKDVGGRWGYAELLEQSMPKATVTQLDDWVEEDFDPNIVDADELAEAVMALARRWSRNAPYHPTGKSGFRQTFLLGLSERSAHYRGLPRRLSSCGSREGREFRANLLR